MTIGVDLDADVYGNYIGRILFHKTVWELDIVHQNV